MLVSWVLSFEVGKMAWLLSAERFVWGLDIQMIREANHFVYIGASFFPLLD